MAKKFNFKFQTLLDVQNRREEIIKTELAMLKEELEKTLQLITQQEDTLQNKQRELREKQLSDSPQEMPPLDKSENQKNQISPVEIQFYQSYFTALEKEITQQRCHASEISKQINITREKLLDISKNIKMLEKLKGKQKEDFLNLLKIEERKFLDEITSCKFARQSVK